MIALACCACSPPTQLLVVVDTDLEPGVEVEAIDVAVSSNGGWTSRSSFSMESTELPFSLGVQAVRPDERVHVSARAIAPSGELAVSYDVDVGFVPGEVRVLEIPLARACVDELSCDDEGMTCLRGSCVPSSIDPSSLPGRSGDEPQPLFDGPRVAPDAGEADAGASCVAGEPCETGNPCEIGERACDPPRCQVSATLAAGTDCGEGRVCDVEGRCAPP